MLLVASAGNDGVNTDTTPHYPSSLPDDIVLAVAATTKANMIWCAPQLLLLPCCLTYPGCSADAHWRQTLRKWSFQLSVCILLQVAEQFWGQVSGRGGTRGAGHEPGPGRLVYQADRDVHGHASCGRGSRPPAEQVRTSSCCCPVSALCVGSHLLLEKTDALRACR